MKKFTLLAFCLFALVAKSYSQDAEIEPLFDYGQNPHEFSVDVKNIFGGELPNALFYRKNYTRNNGSMRGFRINFQVNNYVNVPADNLWVQNQQFKRQSQLAYFISLGKEYQKLTSSRIIAYGGYDAGFGFSSIRYTTDNHLPGELNGRTFQNFVYSLTGFGGVKYHFHPRVSLSAEFGLEASYVRDVDITRVGTRRFPNIEKEHGNSYGLNLLPLRALRMSYHF